MWSLLTILLNIIHHFNCVSKKMLKKSQLKFCVLYIFYSHINEQVFLLTTGTFAAVLLCVYHSAFH